MKNFLLNIIFLSAILNVNSFALSQDDLDQFSAIEEIVVTSQKRANAIAAQDLPASVTAISEDLIIKSGAMPNERLDANAIKALASLPSREELLAKLLGTMQAPIAKFVRTLNEVPTKFVRGLAAVRDQKPA